MPCPWCVHNPYGCDEKICDFKTLPYRKEDIIKRIKQEQEKIDAIKQRLLDSEVKNGDVGALKETEVAEVADISKGISIMVSRLKADFGMTNAEIKDLVGMETSFMDKARMAKKLMQLRKRRKKQLKKKKQQRKEDEDEN